MNNHGIICKNNIMIIFLFFLITSILIFLNKKIKFDIDFSIVGFEYNFAIKINYFFDIATLYKEDFIKLKKKWGKPKATRSGVNKKNYINLKKYKWVKEYINIERINLETNIGLDNVFLTSIAIPFVSTALAMVLQVFLPETVKQFNVKPVYNQLFFALKSAVYIEIKPKDLIYVILKVRKINKKSMNKK